MSGVGRKQYLVLKGIVGGRNWFLFISAERQPSLEQLHLCAHASAAYSQLIPTNKHALANSKLCVVVLPR